MNEPSTPGAPGSDDPGSGAADPGAAGRATTSPGASRTAAPPPSPRPTPPRPPLRRDTAAGMLGGVAAGLANHLAVDVVLVRITFVVGSLLTQGLGVLAYVLCWVFIPKAEPGTAAPVRDEATSDGRGPAFWVGIAFLTAGVLWLLGAMPWLRLFGLGWIDGGVLVPVLLIGLGVALWRTSTDPVQQRATTSTPTTATTTAPPAEASNEPRADGTPPVAPPPPPVAPPPPRVAPPPPPDVAPPPSAGPPPVASASDHPLETSMSTLTPRASSPRSSDDVDTAPHASERTGSEDTARIEGDREPVAGAAAGEHDSPPPPPAAPAGQGDGFTPPPVPEKEPRSLLTRLTLGAALIAVGVLWILEVTTTLALGPLRILAIGLAIVGAGLLVGSVVGRGRGLIVVGVLLLPLVLVGTLFRGAPGMGLLGSTFEDSPWVGERIEEPATIDDLESTYGLAAGTFELDLTETMFDEDTDVLIEIGAGEVVVIVPPDINVEVSANLAGGEIQLFERRVAGLGVELSVDDEAAVADPDAAPTLTLQIDGGFGDLRVRR